MTGRMENTTLQNKILIVLMTSSVLFALVLGLIFYRNTYVTVKESKERELTTLSEETADKVDRFLFERIGDLRVLSESGILLSLEMSDEFKLNYLQNMIKAYQTYDVIFILDPEGKISLSAGDEQKIPDFSKWIPEMLHAPFASGIQIRGNGQRYICFSMPLKDMNGRSMGVVAEVMNFNAVDEIISSVKLGETGSALLQRPEERGPMPVGTRYGKAMNSGSIAVSSAVESLTHEGQRWVVTVQQDVSEAFVIAYTSIEIFFVFVFMIAIVGFFIISMILTRRIAQPVHQLVEKVEGSYGRTRSMGIFSGGDEIKSLSTSFDSLMEELQGLMHQVLVKSGEAVSAESVKALVGMMRMDIPNGIISVNPQGVIVSVNDAAAEILGIPKSQLVDTAVDSHKRADLNKILRWYEGESEWDANEEALSVQGHEGVETPILLRRFKQHDAMGNAIGTTLVINRTEEKQLLENRMAKTRRFSELGELTAGVAHEIRNPLAAIKGYAQMALRELDGNAPAARDIAVVLEETSRIEDLITRFLSFAKPNDPKAAACPVWSMVNDVAKTVRPELESKGIGLDIRVSQKDILTVDRVQIHQVLLNLIFNSLQASPENSAIIVDGDAQAKEGWYCLSVTDAGAGIPTEAMSRVFEPFYTTREKGTGLGLAICARIVENHNGVLELMSVSTGGTRAEIWLPTGKEGVSL